MSRRAAAAQLALALFPAVVRASGACLPLEVTFANASQAYFGSLQLQAGISPDFLEGYYQELSLHLDRLSALPDPGGQVQYLEREAPSSFDWTPKAASARLLLLMALYPKKAEEVARELETFGARRRSVPLDPGIRGRLTGHAVRVELLGPAAWDGSLTGPPSDPAGAGASPGETLRLERRLNPFRPNAFLGAWGTRPVFVKIDATDTEIAAHGRAARAALPVNVSVPNLLAFGQPGLPELPRVEGSRSIPEGYRRLYSLGGRRILLAEPLPEGTVSLESVFQGRVRLASAILREDWQALKEGVRALHAGKVAHGDLGNPANVHLSQAADRTRFHIVDFGRGRLSEEPGFPQDARQDLLDLDRHGGHPRLQPLLKAAPTEKSESPGLKTPEEPGAAGERAEGASEETIAGDSDEEHPADSGARTFMKRAAAAGILAALAFLPTLFEPRFHPWPKGVLFFPDPFLLPINPVVLVGLGALLGWVGAALSGWVHRLAPMTMKGKNGTIEWVTSRRPWSPWAILRALAGSVAEEIGFRLLLFTILWQVLAPLLPLGLLFPASAAGVALVFALRHHSGTFSGRAASSLWFSALYYLSGTVWLPAAAHFSQNLVLLSRLWRRRE